MKLLALKAGEITSAFDGIGTAEHDKRIPIMCFAVIDGEDIVVFDTGMHPAVRTDAIGHWGRIARRRLVPDLPEGADLISLLGRAGVTPEDVTWVVNSHLHNDHCGMNRWFAPEKVLLRRREYEYAVTQMDTDSSGFVRKDFYDDSREPRLFDYDDEYDLLGDGRVVLVSATGHTPGHQVLRVRFGDGHEYVLSGDAVYSNAELCAGQAPAIAWDVELAGQSAKRLSTIAADGATVLVCHDAGTWAGEDIVVVHDDQAGAEA